MELYTHLKSIFNRITEVGHASIFNIGAIKGVLSDILRGKRSLNLGQIKRLSRRFNVNPTTFIDVGKALIKKAMPFILAIKGKAVISAQFPPGHPQYPACPAVHHR